MASTDKQPFEAEFQRDSQKVFKNNVRNYTANDISFLRKINNLYGDALNARGLNVADPFEANMFHYNKLGFRGNIDHPRVSKTYIFFTRPELNFSFENINSVPFFKWLFAQDIGKMIMASLTDPEYFINAPTAFNTSKADVANLVDALDKYHEAVKTSERNMASSSADDGYSKYGLNTNDGQNYAELTGDDEDDVDDLESINLDQLGVDEKALEILSKNASDLAEQYNNFYRDGGPAKTLETALSYSRGRDENGTNNKYVETLVENNMFQAKSSLFGGTDTDAYLNTTPFIPLLSNLTTSMDGARDLNLELYGYEEDEHGSDEPEKT